MHTPTESVYMACVSHIATGSDSKSQTKNEN